MNKIIRTLIISLVITGLLSFNCEYALSMNLNILKKKSQPVETKNTSAADNKKNTNVAKTSSSSGILNKLVKKQKTNKPAQSKQKSTDTAKKQNTQKIVKSKKVEKKSIKLAQAKESKVKEVKDTANTQKGTAKEPAKDVKNAVQETTKESKTIENKKEAPKAKTSEKTAAKVKIEATDKNTKKADKKQKAEKKKKAKKEKYDDAVVTAKTHETKPSVKIIIKSDKKNKKVKDNAKEKQVSEKKKLKKKKSKNNTDTAEPKEREVILKQPAEKTENVPEADVFSSTAAVEGSVSTTRIISVDDCVKIALENNPSILSQLISKDIYKNQIAQAWANYFPTLNASASYSRNDMLVTNFRFPMQKYNQWNTPSLGVNLLIYDFGKTSSQAGIAKKTYEASRETLQSSINDVVYQVKSAYYNQLFLQQQVQVYEDSVLQYQIHLEQAKAYYAIGSKAKIDVSTAELNLDNTKLTLVQAKNSVETGFAQLTNAMGVPEFEKFEIQDRLDKRRYDITFNESLKIACDQNPTLQAAKKKMEGSKLLVKSAKVAFLPDITGFGQYSRGGGEPNKDYGYQLGAQISYSNLNLLLLKQRVDEATLTYKKDQADYETQRQKLYLDVKQAYIQLKNAQESIPVARASMNVAKERYDLAAGRYKAGLGDAIEIKDAQITYQNAKLQFYNTLMQYHIAAANLERVIGAPLTATEINL